MRNVQLTENNPNIKYYENRSIIGKSDIKSNVFDLFYFVNRDISEDVTIPLSIKIIISGAFSNCNIKSIKIPSNDTEIHNHAFKFCENLEEVEIPENSQLIKIGKGAFEYSNIKYIFIPQNVVDIGEHAFYSCNNLTKVEFQKILI